MVVCVYLVSACQSFDPNCHVADWLRTDFAQHQVDTLPLDISPVAYLARLFPGQGEQAYRSQLGHFGLTGLTGLQLIGTLSGGQKSRVAFAILALQRPHLLILDEVRLICQVCTNADHLGSQPITWISKRTTHLAML